MRFTLLFAIILWVFSGLGQNETDEIELWYEGKPIQDEIVIDIHDFHKVRIMPEVWADSLEVQFYIVPISGTIISFTQQGEDLENTELLSKLELGEIPVHMVSHVIMVLRQDEMHEGNRYGVYTRKLETADDYYNEYKSYFNGGKPSEALDYVGVALEMDSTNIDYINAWAELSYAKGRAKAAKKKLNSAISIEPNFASYNMLGFIALQEDRLDAAEKFAKNSEKFAENDEEKCNTYYLFGGIALKKYDYNQAYKNFKKALRYNPNHLNVLNDIASVCDEVNKRGEKIGYLEKVLELDSSYYLVHNNIGFHYLQDGDYEKALNEFNAVLEVEPYHGIALSNKSFCLLKLGKLDEAMTAIFNSLSIFPRNSYAFKNRALIYIEMEDFEAACKDLQMAKDLKFTEQYGSEVDELMEKWCN